MSKVKCLNCEQVFDEEDVVIREECVGEFWGSPAYERRAYCPYCGEDAIDYEYVEEDEEDEE